MSESSSLSCHKSASPPFEVMRKSCYLPLRTMASCPRYSRDLLLTFRDRMGSPKDLFRAKGTFYDMVQHSGEVKELQGVFGDSDE